MIFFPINPILIVAAVIPAIALFIFIYRQDKAEKESPRMLFSLVFFGIISTALALVSERVGTFVLDLVFRGGNGSALAYNLVMYFVVVGLSEEGFKYLVLKKRTWRSPEFNYQFDGIVYAVCVSLGFALWENIGYVAMYGLRTALVRAVTAVPGHACFGVFMGTWYGIAKKYDMRRRPGQSKFFRILSVLLPTLLHGAYDFIATSEAQSSEWIFIVFVAALFLLSFIIVRQNSKHDRYIGGWGI